jgi:hypothetical protein
MPKYVIERGIPGLGQMSEDDLRNISEKSCDVLRDLGGDVQWVHSYVTDEKLFCVYIAPNEERVYEHAHRGGFPAEAVLQVHTIIDPTTAEAPVRATA